MDFNGFKSPLLCFSLHGARLLCDTFEACLMILHSNSFSIAKVFVNVLDFLLSLGFPPCKVNSEI